jgi:BMFP domain-containing protein YqiC
LPQIEPDVRSRSRRPAPAASLASLGGVGDNARDEVTMQTDNRLLDDIARAASGALGALSGVRTEIESQLRGVMERWLKAQDLVTREEFEVVKEMAARARTENETLAAKVATLEAALAALQPRRD